MASQESWRDVLLNTPALLPPKGVEPDFINPPTIRPQLLGILISMFLLPTSAVAIRVYTKVVIIKKLVLEDYLIVCAWLLYIAGYQTINCIMINMKGTGTHQWNLRVKDMIPYLYYVLVMNVICSIIFLLIKVAIILQCLRVLVPSGIRDATFWILHALLWAHIIFYVAGTFTAVFFCSPLSKAWDPTVQGGHCINRTAANIVGAAINTASDLVLVVVPQIIIWRLKMPTRKKWALSVVFFIGLFACAAAAARLYFSINLLRNADFTWIATMTGTLGLVETCCGFLVACIPVFPRFFKSQPIFSTVCSSLRHLLCNKRSTSGKHSSRRLGNIDASEPKKKPNVTDVEFEELVMRTGLSLGTDDPSNA